ncbi:MAG: transposase, partial [Prevotellaceae bacterium]|nr:transposase [Prevotellaceae bacterium]
FADRGYISPKLFDSLFDDGIQLVHGIKANMKNKLMSFVTDEWKGYLPLKDESIRLSNGNQKTNLHSHRCTFMYLTNILNYFRKIYLHVNEFHYICIHFTHTELS